MGQFEVSDVLSKFFNKLLINIFFLLIISKYSLSIIFLKILKKNKLFSSDILFINFYKFVLIFVYASIYIFSLNFPIKFSSFPITISHQ